MDEDTTTIETIPKEDHDKVLEELETLKSQQGKNQGAVERLLADPDIQKVLELKSSGKAVSFADEREEPQYETPTGDLEDMTNTELAAYVTKGLLTELPKVIKSDIEGLKNSLEAVEAKLRASETQQIKSQVESLSQKYKDFSSFKPQMAEIAQQNPALSVEELYILAKSRSGSPLTEDSTTSTEKPSSAPGKAPKKRDIPPGQAGFRQLLDGALAELDLDM